MTEIDSQDDFFNIPGISKGGTKSNIRLDSYRFNIAVNFGMALRKLELVNCTFRESATFSTAPTNSFELVRCNFLDTVSFDGLKIDVKTRIRECIFTNTVSFANTSFKALADFYKTEFHKKTIFYKTDFFGNVVFAGSRFEQNVLFSYTSIHKYLILRNTHFSKGIDLSLALIDGKLSVFNTHLALFPANCQKLSEADYDTLISSVGDIPIKNQRETFRILKQSLFNQDNKIEAQYFSKLEKEVYFKEIKYLKEGTWIQNRIILFSNKISNNHNQSWIRGMIFTMTVGLLFFYLAIINTAAYQPAPYLYTDTIKSSLKYFVAFLNPTHRLGYFNELGPSWAFYCFDFTGRIFISFGIYQTIQAFRKYRSN